MTARPTIVTRAGGSGRSLQAARQHRAVVQQAMEDFARAVDTPADGAAWRVGVQRQLAELRAALTEHIVMTEGPDGLYAELLEHAPRLSRGVAGLTAEHDALLVALDSLAQRLDAVDADGNVSILRFAAGELLDDLARHRQRGADLVYEAYATDIGGET